MPPLNLLSPGELTLAYKNFANMQDTNNMECF